MMMTLAIPKETLPAERRVALVPTDIAALQTLNFTVLVESHAGVAAGYADENYTAAGATVLSSAAFWSEIASIASSGPMVIAKVKAPSLNEIQHYPSNTTLIGMLAPHDHSHEIAALLAKKITCLTLERLPRITRAQSMDVLSSQATVAGYKAALNAAQHSSRLLPMFTTAAGTVRPATALVIGAGVAGLQAIATLKRLGAIVMAFDIRPAARQQIESLGAKMIALDINAEGQGGYARELTDSEKQQLNELLATQIKKMDIVIATAALPGKPAPKIISRAMITSMPAGSIIVDLAAESGGNTTETQVGKIIEVDGVLIDGSTGVPATVPKTASDLYSRNITRFLPLVAPQLATEDEIIQSTLITLEN